MQQACLDWLCVSVDLVGFAHALNLLAARNYEVDFRRESWGRTCQVAIAVNKHSVHA